MGGGGLQDITYTLQLLGGCLTHTLLTPAFAHTCGCGGGGGMLQDITYTLQLLGGYLGLEEDVPRIELVAPPPMRTSAVRALSVTESASR